MRSVIPDPFRFLPLSDRKGMPTPRVVFRDTPDFGGAYYPRASEKYIDEWLDLDRGEFDIIVLSVHWGDTAGSVLAHEHRHLQQRYSLSLPSLDGPGRHQFDDGGTPEGWRAAIRRYYHEQAWEMDALRYSMRVHSDQTAICHWEQTL